MSIFHHIYSFVGRMPEQGLITLLDELFTAVLVLPLAEASARWPVSIQVSATDASSRRGGQASTLTTKAFAKTLYRFSEKNGVYPIRLG